MEELAIRTSYLAACALTYHFHHWQRAGYTDVVVEPWLEEIAAIRALAEEQGIELPDLPT